MTGMVAIAIWRKKAACSGEKETFENNPKKAKKELCSKCPVADQCFRYALIYGEHGIWGGTTKEARESLIESDPGIRLRLIEEAKALGIYESRYTVDQYWAAIRESRKFSEGSGDPLIFDRGHKPIPFDWSDPGTWLSQVG